jgi:hypothetical protein
LPRAPAEAEVGVSERKPNPWLSLIVWLLPGSSVKNSLLRLLGNRIGSDARLGPALVLGCGQFVIGDGVLMGSFNIFRRLTFVDLSPRSRIGGFNQFTAAADYQRFSPLVGQLIMGESAIITNRHYLDCSGQVILEPYAGMGGIRSIIQSHEIDLAINETSPGRVILGVGAMSGTACVMLKGAYLPEHSVLAAGALLNKSKPGADMPTHALYGGVPARFLREIKDFTWWDRTVTDTDATPFDDAEFREVWDQRAALREQLG